MSQYNRNARVAPKTLTAEEQEALLSATGKDEKHFRDHVLFVLALGTGLRQHELVALNVGDVLKRNGKARKRVQLTVFKKSGPSAPYQEVMLSTQLREVLERFYKWKKTHGESVDNKVPVFVSRNRNRLATRTVRHIFAVWQERAEFDRQHTFHSLRHTAAMNHFRQEGDIRLTQRFLRHKNLNTTMIYTLPTDDELSESVEKMVLPGVKTRKKAA